MTEEFSKSDQHATFKAIQDSWTEAMPDLPFAADIPWRHSGADSLRTLIFVLKLEQTLKRKIPLDQFHPDTTVQSLIRFLDNGVAAQRARFTIHLVPGILGDEPLLAGLRQSLLPDIDTATLALPDLSAPDRILASVPETAAALIAHVHTPSAQPVVLVGYSFGGLVALELARQLTEAGKLVGLVCLIDSFVADHRGFKARVEMLMQYIAAKPAAAPPELASLAARKDEAARPGMIYRLEQGIIGGLCRIQMIGLARRLFPIFENALPFERRVARKFQLLAALRHRGIMHWHPRPYPGDVLLFTSDDPRAKASLEFWHALCPRLRVTPVEGVHRDMLKGSSFETIRSAILMMVSQMEDAAEKGVQPCD